MGTNKLFHWLFASVFSPMGQEYESLMVVWCGLKIPVMMVLFGFTRLAELSRVTEFSVRSEQPL